MKHAEITPGEVIAVLIIALGFGAIWGAWKDKQLAEAEAREVCDNAVLVCDVPTRTDTLVFITDHLTTWQELLLAIAYTESRFNPQAVGKARIYYPILEWELEDEERFVSEEGVKCAPLYYDEAGNFHAERRLGCIGCPLPSDRGRGDYLQYPKMLQLLVKHAQTYFDTHTHKRI